MRSLTEQKSSHSRFKPMELNKRQEFRGRNAMAEIENLKNSAERCFELASSSDFLEEDVALQAFELLTANSYDGILAHALGVSL